MAYTKKYEAYFSDGGGEITDLTRSTYRVELLQDGGSGAVVEIANMAPSPLVISSVLASRGSDVVVVGSQATFTVQVQDANIVTPIMESEYREWRMDVYNHDTSTLIFRGYVQPENMSRSIYEPWIVVEIVATDALRDLSQIRYEPEIVPGSEKATAMQCIKEAIEYIGIELPFRVKLGTYEKSKPSTELSLLNCYVDRRRFFSLVDGREENDTCLDVVEKILAPFGCTLRQAGGEYRIQQTREADTFDYTFAWALTGVARTAAADVVNIDDIRFTRGAEVSKLSPVRVLDITHYNRNFGDSLVANLNVFEGVDSPWDVQFSLFEVDFQGRLVATISDSELQDPDGNIIRRMALANTFEVERLTDNDYIEFSFRAFAQNTIGLGIDPADSTRGVRIYVSIVTPEGTETLERAITGSEQDYILQVPVLSTGVYSVSLQIILINPEDGYSGEIVFSRFDIRRRTLVDGKIVSDITFDTFHRFTSQKGKVSESSTIWFADSFTSNDLGRFTIIDGGNHVATENWARFGKSETKTLIQTYAANYLSRRSEYTDHLSITFLDTGKALLPSSILSFDGKYYLFSVFSRDYRTNIVTSQIEEVIYDDVTYDQETSGLNTVDGKGAGGVRSETIGSASAGNVFTERTIFPGIERLMSTLSQRRKQITLLKRPYGLLQGGTVDWSGTGFSFNIDAALFAFDGRIYYFPGSVEELTLQSPPALQSRIDVLYLAPASGSEDEEDEPLSGTVYILQGVEAADPIKPIIDPSVGVELTSLLLPAGSGSFSTEVFQEVVYDEEDEEEWPVGGSNCTVETDGDVDPYRGDKHIKVFDLDFEGTTPFVEFVAPSAIDPRGYGIISLWLKLSAPTGITQLSFGLYRDIGGGGREIYSELSFASMNGSTTEWQNVQVRVSGFNIFAIVSDRGEPYEIESIRLLIAPDMPDFFLDYVRWAGGISQPVPIDKLELIGDIEAVGNLGRPIVTKGVFPSLTEGYIPVKGSGGLVDSVLRQESDRILAERSDVALHLLSVSQNAETGTSRAALNAEARGGFFRVLRRGDLGDGRIIYGVGSTGYNIVQVTDALRIDIGWGATDGANVELYHKTNTSAPGRLAFVYGGGDYGDIIFTRYDGTNFHVALKVTKDGHVGIGTDTPTARLDINGTLRARGLTEQTTHPRVLVADADGNIDYVSKAGLIAGDTLWELYDDDEGIRPQSTDVQKLEIKGIRLEDDTFAEIAASSNIAALVVLTKTSTLLGDSTFAVLNQGNGLQFQDATNSKNKLLIGKDEDPVKVQNSSLEISGGLKIETTSAVDDYMNFAAIDDDGNVDRMPMWFGEEDDLPETRDSATWYYTYEVEDEA